MKKFTVAEVAKLKAEGKVDVFYPWYDHMWLRHNGDAEIVQAAIADHDFEVFKKYADYYNKEGEAEKMTYFPSYAFVHELDGDQDVLGEVDIMSPGGFSLIDGSEYECG